MWSEVGSGKLGAAQEGERKRTSFLGAESVFPLPEPAQLVPRRNWKGWGTTGEVLWKLLQHQAFQHKAPNTHPAWEKGSSPRGAASESGRGLWGPATPQGARRYQDLGEHPSFQGAEASGPSPPTPGRVTTAADQLLGLGPLPGHRL